MRHQFECQGSPEDREKAKRMNMLDPEEVKKIEKTTPFIKTGQLRKADEVADDENLLANMKLSELSFEDKIIGKGSYGSVQLATHVPTNMKVAVKKLDKGTIKTPKMQETLNREIQIQKKLKHVNIVRLFASLEDEKYIYLILEYVEQGNLFYIIRKKGMLTEDEAFYFFIQTVAGIYFLHKNGFIHRDLKPENLLVNEDNVLKICDFGWTCESDLEEDDDG